MNNKIKKRMIVRGFYDVISFFSETQRRKKLRDPVRTVLAEIFIIYFLVASTFSNVSKLGHSTSYEPWSSASNLLEASAIFLCINWLRMDMGIFGNNFQGKYQVVKIAGSCISLAWIVRQNNLPGVCLCLNLEPPIHV